MVYVFLAEGFEEIEALATVDILRRAGLDVKTAGVGAMSVKSARSIVVQADLHESEVSVSQDVQAVILPGGGNGTINLEKSSTVQKILDDAYQKGILMAAICAAPSILGHKGLLQGKQATAFPGFEKDLYGAVLSDQYVCTDGNIITAKGAGVSIDFALAIVSYLVGKEKSEEIRAAMQCRI